MSDDNPSTRTERFEAEIAELNVTGGRANPERRLLVLGIVLVLGGLAIGVASFIASSSANDARDQNDLIILSLIGVMLVVAGSALAAVMATTRFLRYWLVRLIYEHREQTDRLAP